MSEEKLISEEEIKKVEAEIASKQAEELRRLSEEQAKVIENRVRQEMSEKAEKEAMAKRIEELEKANKATEANLAAQLKAEKEAFEKRLAELEAVRKGASVNQSPFQEPKGNIRNGVDVDKLDLKRVEEDSRRAFVDRFRLPPDFGTPRYSR